MKNSTCEQLASKIGRALIDWFYWLDWDLGIDAGGLMLSMDWFYWFVWFALQRGYTRGISGNVLPSAWYWGEQNAYRSHQARPWNNTYPHQDYEVDLPC